MKLLKKRSNYFVISIIFLIYWPLWYFRYNVASDLHHMFSGELINQLSVPMTWKNDVAVGMGDYAVKTMWSWAVHIPFGIFGNLRFSHELLLKLFMFIPIFSVGVYSTDKFLSYYKMNKRIRIVFSLFYLLTTYFILLMDGGQVTIALAYSLFPLTYYQYKKSTSDHSFLSILVFSSLVLILSIIEIRSLFFVGILILFNFIFDALFDRRLTVESAVIHLKLGLITVFVLCGFHAYWIFPSVFTKAPSLPPTFDRLSQLETMSLAKIEHALYLSQPHWYKNVFGQVGDAKPLLVVLPLLAFLAPVFKKKSKDVCYWLFICMLSAFLIKGTNEPFGWINSWLFENVPGFSFFRDPTKFYFILSLSYLYLIALAVSELSRKFKLASKYAVPALMVYLIVIAYPVYFGKMTGTMAKPVFESEYLSLSEGIENDNNFSRIAWIPTKAPLGLSSSNHPSISLLDLASKRPFAIGTVGKYESFNFIRESEYMGEIFNISGISHIIYPYPDERKIRLSDDEADYYRAFSEQLDDLNWINKISDPPVEAFKTKGNQDRFFLAGNAWLVIGSDSIYQDFFEYSNLGFSDNAIIFAEEKPGITESLVNENSIVVLGNDNNFIDEKSSFIKQDDMIFPARYLGFSPDDTGWWKRETSDFLWWRDFLQSKYGIDNQDFDYGGGYAIAEGDSELAINNSKLYVGKLLLVRVMESSKGGRVEFWQENEKIGEVNTKIENPNLVQKKLTGYEDMPDKEFNYDEAVFHWHVIGELRQSGSLRIKAYGDINVINVMAIMGKEEWERSDEGLFDHRIINLRPYDVEAKKDLFDDTRLTNGSIKYRQINPAHYEVAVAGINRPTMLVFSESYDPLWKISKTSSDAVKSSIPVYSIINGFMIEEDGEYDIYFEPQKYVLPGLVISSITIFLLFGLVVIAKLNK